jgi:hypothetical protein
MAMIDRNLSSYLFGIHHGVLEFLVQGFGN